MAALLFGRSAVRLRCLVIAATTLTAMAGGMASASTRYDPRLRFRTISTPRFEIHFHQGEEALARRLAGLVEDAAAEVDEAIGPPSGRVQIILVAQHDLANGWATPLPYNTIEISTAAPSAESIIGNTDDWLRIVFIHEYTHIAHLSRAAGWIGGLRRAFGRLPLLFPNVYQPIWGIEGLATWQESAGTQGRVPAGDFRLLIDRAAAVDRFEPLDRVNGGNVDWPGGTGPYLYGAYFHEYLARQYGADSLRTLVDETSRTVPYFTSRAYRRVFGRSLGELWTDFAAAAASKSASNAHERQVAVRVTHHGFNVTGPRFAPDGRIFYSSISPHEFPALMEAGGASSEPRHVAKRFLGNRIAIAGDMLVVDEIDLVESVASQSDLYFVDPRTGRRTRLTSDARALDPDVSAGSRMLACVVQMSDRRALATFPLPRPGQLATPEIVVDEPGTSFSSPRWSPDGRLIAAERRIAGGAAEIVIVDPRDRSIRVAARLPGGRSASPVWTPDGTRIIFSAAVDSQPFRLYAVEIATDVISVLEGTGPSAQSPDISADGADLVFVGYTPDGYDLFRMKLAGNLWVRYDGQGPALIALARKPDTTNQPAMDAGSYRPWPTLLPRFWTPTVESDSDELVIGAATGSFDALGRHAYGVEGGWATRARPDWRIAYAYDRWRPTFFVSASDDTDPWRGGELRALEVDAGMLFRVARVRQSHSTLAAFHVARDTFECPACTPEVNARARRGALRIGWEFNNSRGFGYSISTEEGGRMTFTAEATREALGSDGDGFAATVDVRRYWRLWPRHGVLAARGAAAGSWGDAEAARRFSASGHGPQPAGFGFGHDAIGLIRGFDEDDVTGTRAATMNVDYRLPLWRADRGAGTIPVFLRVLHGTVFVDVGHAWTDRARWSDARASIGAELSIDTVVGFVLPLSFSAGAAWRHDGLQDERGFVTFARIGRAF